MLAGLNWVNYGALLPMKTMIQACPFRCGLLLLSVLLASPGHAADTPDPTRDKPSLAFDGWDAFVERAMADWKVPGLALAVVRDGKVIQMKGYGFRDLEKKLPVTPRTLFAIGSITKSFTVTGLGMLVDEGKLQWDEPVRTYLPDFRLKDPVAGEVFPAPAGDPFGQMAGGHEHQVVVLPGAPKGVTRLEVTQARVEFRAGQR